MTPFWLYGVPIVCLALTLVFYMKTRQDIATLAENQRQLSADLDAARGVNTISVAGAPALGPADQVLTLVEFSDYECPFCVRHFTSTMPQIDEKYIRTGKIRYVFKDFPIDQLHPGALRAHEAARCAGEQNKFWEMHTRMFSPPGSHTDAVLDARATEAGVTMAAFKDCLGSGRHTAGVRESVQMAAGLGANGTPAFFIGVRDPATDEVKIVTTVTGAQPFEEFEKALAAVAARIN
jgi:protein-disulfide isomerase